jgi:hypothetical protein
MPKKKPDPRPVFDTRSLGVYDAVTRLVSVLAANDSILPSEMLSEIDAISKPGADPEWQIKRLTEILDRWATQH